MDLVTNSKEKLLKLIRLKFKKAHNSTKIENPE